MKRICFSAALMTAALAGPAGAQVTTVPVTAVDTLATMETSNFFFALIAGLLLALGFQYVLTLISAAMGVSVVHIDSHPHEGDTRGYPEDLVHDENHPGLHEEHHSRRLGLKITNGLGVWSMLTVALSLFLATWLAVQLSLSASAMTGMVLGLVIWAGFTILATWLEMKSFGSLIGGLAHVATSGVRRTLGTAGHMLGHSRENEIKDIAESTVKAVRRELSEALEQSRIVEKLDDYMRQLKPEPIDYHRVRKEVEKLISRIQVTDTTQDGDRLLILHLASKMPHLSKDDVGTIRQSFDEVMELRHQQGLSVTDKVMKGFDKFTPGSEEETRELRHRIAEYLRRTQLEELEPELLKRDLEQMIHQPQMAGQILRNKLEQLDHDTIVGMLSARQDVSPELAEKIASQVEQVWTSIQEKVGDVVGLGSPIKGDMQKIVADNSENSLVLAGQYPVDVNSSETQDQFQRIPEKVEDTIRDALNGLERPEFNYDLIKRDLKMIMHHPDLAPEILKQRLRTYDRESLVALLGSTGMLSRRDIAKIADQIEYVRDEVINTKDEVEHQVRERIELARRRALERAEATRKTVATAGWWMAGTAVCSGLAAALGGWLAALY